MGRAFAASVVGLLLSGSPLLAQAEAEQPSYALPWTFAALFTAGILLIVCVPSRKGRERESSE